MPNHDRSTLDGSTHLIEQSVQSYAKHHETYDGNHPEIFNEIEQARLRDSLRRVVSEAEVAQPRALDLGAGSGNVTAHLLDLGARVTAAEVSPHFIELLEQRFGDAVETVHINGVDLEGLPASTFDLVTLYSVLHHIPDYLAIVDEIARVLRPGGLVYFDHEVNEEYWRPDGGWAEFRRAADEHRRLQGGLWNPHRRRWQRLLIPRNYSRALHHRRDPEYMMRREGDIHVTPDDHIEWPKLAERVQAAGMSVVRSVDYLNYNADYPIEVWERFRDRGCTNMRYLVARRD
jgi:SAM-dependent methyltransferase